MKSTHFAGLDGLRFISILFVVLAHLATFKNSFGFTQYDFPLVYWLAVCGIRIFFIGSGFLITYLLLKEYQAHSRINLKNFIIRRILRIWPAYFLLVFLFLLLFKLPFFRIPGTTDAYLHVNYVVSNGLYVLFLPHVQPFLYPTTPLIFHTYTIGIEEQFYLLWGLLIARFHRHIHLIFWGILLASPLLGFLHSVSYAYVQSHDSSWRVLRAFNAFATYFAYSQFSTFAIGSLFAYSYFHNKKWVFYFKRRPVQIAVYAAVLLFLFVRTEIPFISYDYVSALMACILIMATFKKESLINYDSRWMSHFGRTSYGIYLFHLFGIVLACHVAGLFFTGEKTYWVTVFLCLCTLAFSILFGELSYRYFESYFLRLKDRFKSSPKKAMHSGTDVNNSVVHEK